ncbi:LLM class flavin-dependent oxidoreductase [Nocardioides sp. Kera G14]|uniref:LLM class flavin-dependent oxidoreductase n=1 Tax=Nocardioides sp. Kera G14 TaxID=2884264 RepID=UPI001D10E4ED|nr:LLM class flavin-dependent oxidoreductase [Nocardioides sp. Kera G14]UDY23033.1 LLM class flavin-dependent oxidoreductase [Nocardioides sp. Kera G14]
MTITAPVFDSHIPETAAPDVKFISLSHLNPSTELNPVQVPHGIDVAFFKRYFATLEQYGFDYTLLPYGSNSADSFITATAVGVLTENLRPIVALRPNTVFPLVAAQKLATLDQLTEGRAVVHLISGGADSEQARQGDYLPKEKRYARTSEYIDLLRAAWTEKAPFSHDGEFYRFDDFGPGFSTYSGEPVPISIGGQSDEAFQVGGTKADIFSFWGEPLPELRTEIDRVNAIAAGAARPNPNIWVTFRPIIAPTDAQAWEKAHEYVAKIGKTHQLVKDLGLLRNADPNGPQNKGSQRSLQFAAASELYDRALWTKTAAATGGLGASTALVGSPETVAAAILDYVDQGATHVSIRGYDTYEDVIDYGKHILPLVRQELAHRKATGQRGRLQGEHLGNYTEEYRTLATAGQA